MWLLVFLCSFCGLDFSPLFYLMIFLHHTHIFYLLQSLIVYLHTHLLSYFYFLCLNFTVNHFLTSYLLDNAFILFAQSLYPPTNLKQVVLLKIANLVILSIYVLLLFMKQW